MPDRVAESAKCMGSAHVSEQCFYENCPQTIEKEQEPTSKSPNLNVMEILYPQRVTLATDNLVEGPFDGLPPLPFCKFHRGLTFRLHSINTTCTPCLPAYTRIPRHISHHCGGGPACLPADPTLSSSPMQWCCHRLQLCLCSDDWECQREAPVSRRLVVAPPTLSVPCERLHNFPITP